MADLLPIMGAGSYSYLENTSNELELLKEYAYDIEKDDYILDSSGNFEIVYGLDALIIRNYLTLKTYKGRYFIFGYEGSELKKLINKDYEFVKLHAQEYIENAILDGKYVKSIEDMKIEVDGSRYVITFKVNSVYGTYEEKEVV